MIENDLCLGKGNCLKKIFGRFKHRTNLKILKPQGTVWGSQAWLSCLGSTPAYIIVLSPCKCFLKQTCPSNLVWHCVTFCKGPKDKAQGQGPRTRPKDKDPGRRPRYTTKDQEPGCRTQDPRRQDRGPSQDPEQPGPRTQDPGPKTQDPKPRKGPRPRPQGPERRRRRRRQRRPATTI